MRHEVQDHAVPEAARGAGPVEGRWREWGLGGEPVTWPPAPRDPAHDRAGHELTDAEIARVSQMLRRRPFRRLACALLGLPQHPARRRDR